MKRRNNAHFKSGYLTGSYLLVLEVVLALVGNLILKNINMTNTLVVGLLLVGSAVFLGYSGHYSILNPTTHMKVQLFLYLITGLFTSLIFNSAQVFIYTAFYSAMVAIVYMDVDYCKFHFTIYTIILAIMTIFIHVYVKSSQSMSEFIFGIVTVLILNLINTTISYFISYQERSNEEHERSLDDLLEIVELKVDEARAATKSKSRFLANMSHEIRTPINSVIGMNEMILRESTQEEIRSYAADVDTAAQALLGIINDILDISKIEEGKISLVPVSYSPASILSALYKLTYNRAEGKGLTLNIIADEDIPSRLFGDDIRIKQILTNILTNAIKYTSKGTVTLSVTRLSKNVFRFEVKDTGIGIKQEDLSKLYTAFERIEEKRNRNIEGTGLGINITCAFLNAMGSQLEVESVYGVGSTFAFNLVQEVIDETPIGTLKFASSEPGVKRYRVKIVAPEAKILVVDDNDLNLRVFTNLLKPTQVNVTTCGRGQDCLELVKENNYDIIFMDHMMPEMDGIETFHHIRNGESPCTDIPIVILTANAINGAEEMYYNEGFDGYLTKPIDAAALEEILFSLISKELQTEVPDNAHSSTHEKESTRELNFPITEGFDWNYAKLHLLDADVIEDTLKSFYASIIPAVNELDIYYDVIDTENGIDAYRIRVHSMKSSASLIGGISLAGMAMELEKAAREQNRATIKGLHPIFKERWIASKELISWIAPEESTEKTEAIGHADEIKRIFEELLEAADSMDMDALDDLAEKLSSFSFPDSISGDVEKIVSMIFNFDTDGLSSFDYNHITDNL